MLSLVYFPVLHLPMSSLACSLSHNEPCLGKWIRRRRQRQESHFCKVWRGIHSRGHRRRLPSSRGQSKTRLVQSALLRDHLDGQFQRQSTFWARIERRTTPSCAESFRSASLRCSAATTCASITLRCRRCGWATRTAGRLWYCSTNRSESKDGDTVVLRVHLYLWYSIRGYMYQFFNTNEHPLYHVVGEQDVQSGSWTNA